MASLSKLVGALILFIALVAGLALILKGTSVPSSEAEGLLRGGFFLWGGAIIIGGLLFFILYYTIGVCLEKIERIQDLVRPSRIRSYSRSSKIAGRDTVEEEEQSVSRPSQASRGDDG